MTVRGRLLNEAVGVVEGTDVVAAERKAAMLNALAVLRATFCPRRALSCETCESNRTCAARIVDILGA